MDGRVGLYPAFTENIKCYKEIKHEDALLKIDWDLRKLCFGRDAPDQVRSVLWNDEVRPSG